MGQEQIVTLNINVEEFIMEFVPKIAKVILDTTGGIEEIKSKELSLTIDISGVEYSFIVKGGSVLEVKKGKLDNPLVLISIALEDIEKLIQLKNIDLLLGFQEKIGPESPGFLVAKSNQIMQLNGISVFELSHPDGSITPISVTFNGAEAPKAIIQLPLEDVAALTSKESNPVQLFISGDLKIEGDLGFAMTLQPLFT